MRTTLLFLVAFIIGGAVLSNTLSAQSRRWKSIAGIPARITVIKVVDDSTAFVGTSTPSLILLRHKSIAWEIPLDTVPLPYFDYPHGDIIDILPVSSTELWLAFQYGYGLRIDLATKEKEEIRLAPIRQFARSGNGTIIAGSHFRSTDAGATWDTITPENRPAAFNAVTGGEGNTFYATDEKYSGLWVSDNGGISWQQKPALITTADSLNSAGKPLMIFDERTILLFAAHGTPTGLEKVGIYRSIDRGESWETSIQFDGPTAATHSQEGDNAFIGTRDGSINVQSTTDRGATWVEMNDGLPESPGIDAIGMHGTTVLAALLGELYSLENVSAVVSAPPTETVTIQLRPNPVRETSSITIRSRTPLTGIMQVYNMLGECILRTESIACPAGETHSSLDVASLPEGMYRVVLIDTQGRTIDSQSMIVGQ